MARKYISVKSRGYKKNNWSHENKGCAMTIGTTATNGLYQGGSIIVPADTNPGTRTVGKWTITVPVHGGLSGVDVYWALVYVPQGTTANNLFSTTGSKEGSLYEPNQFVLASGISDANAGPIRIRSNMMRKLHSNDFVSLILGYQGDGASSIGNTAVTALVSYSIKYN